MKQEIYLKAQKQCAKLKVLAESQIERITLDTSQDGSQGVETHSSGALDKMLGAEYSPPEIVIELAKCILGMLHYRVLSWAQFKVTFLL
jgi:hypothetical protein